MSTRSDKAGGVRIELLADHPHAIETLKTWFEQEWAPYYGPEGPGDAVQDLLESCNRNDLPIALVAFCDDAICGTAALKVESIKTHTHLTPWLAALLVGRGFRRRGVAEQLIAAIEEIARRMSCTCIYVGTGEGSGTPESAIRRRGWEFLETAQYFISDVSIFEKKLQQAGKSAGPKGRLLSEH